jgi:Rab GDP dissociation inhibitor
LEFQKAAGSYVYKDGKIHKVPSSASEALASSLMGFFEKRRCAKLLQFITNYRQENPKTHNGLDCSKVPFRAVCEKFGVDENTKSFLGHAVALYTDDSFMDKRACEVMDRISLYHNSISNLSGGSPYLYPRHGLSELPQGFARQGAVYGATTMLRAPLKEICYDGDVVSGIKLKVNEEEEFEVKCKYVLGDPSYFPEKVQEVGKVCRIVCVLDHAIPNTDNAHSVQIIIPQKESRRSHDIYIVCFSSVHCVAPEGKYLAIISMELDEKEAAVDPMKLFGGVMKLLGPVSESVVLPSTLYAPKGDGLDDKCFISESYDGTSHFQSAAQNILDLYKRITGNELELTNGDQEGQ